MAYAQVIEPTQLFLLPVIDVEIAETDASFLAVY